MQNNELENNIGYVFKNENLKTLAFVHPSYVNEHNLTKADTNQRLEFLGDAVLELITSDYLYKHYADFNEGNLTKLRAKLVCEENLSSVGRYLQLYNYLLLGNGESRERVAKNESIMCDTVEAVIGAIFLDSGLEDASAFIYKYILTDENIKKVNDDYKTVLQEYANKEKLELSYVLKKEEGPDHNKKFYMDVLVDGTLYGSGIGKTKKAAEQDAAMSALKKIGKV